MQPGRPAFASGDWFRGSDEEIKEEALGYIVVKIEGDMLHLSSATPIMSGGKMTMSHLSWKRAQANV